MTSSPISSMSSPAAPRRAAYGLPDIAFIGRAGSGKSTAAQLLREQGVAIGDGGEWACHYQPMSFARPLREVAVRLWGESAYNDRDKLQRLGVAVREIAQDTWLDLFERQFLDEAADFDGLRNPVVVDDCRFPNEYHRLKALGFVVVRVQAEQWRRVNRLQANGKFQNLEQLEHVSESALDDIAADYTLTNDGTTMDLYGDLVTKVIMREVRR